MEKTTDNPLLNYGIDLTEKAKAGKLDKVWGRDEEMVRATQILSRRKKNNLLLVGEPGVGKTAIAEKIAQQIVNKEVSHTLQNKVIFSLDIASIIAGTQYRGQMEERLKVITDYLAKNPQIILFIDEIHTIMESSSNNTMSIANIFKPYLTNGTIQCIGATTNDEFKKYFEKDGAMSRRFQKLIIEDPSPETTIQILTSCKDVYEDYHSVFYPLDIIEEIPYLAKRYLPERHLPDSAIDLLDEVGAKVTIDTMATPPKITKLENELENLNSQKKILIKEERWQDIIPLKKSIKKNQTSLVKEIEKWEDRMSRKTITKEDLLHVLSLQSKIPLDDMTLKGGDKIDKLINSFNNNIIGQQEAKDKIVRALRRNILGISNPNRPVASFLLLGRTGVGKTEIAKILANTWYNDNMLRLDMSEFMEKISSTQLTGSPPGYVGHEKGGRFEQIRRNPYSLILLDEIEKANSDVLNTLLQILDNGEITDGAGRKISFRNTIIIMTSNLGAKESAIKSTGFKQLDNTLNDKSIEMAKKFFSPEIWNRIDEVVVFDSLDRDHISKILDIEVEKIILMLKENRNINLKINKKAKEFLANKGFDETYGARFLKRVIQQELVDVVSEYLLLNDVKENNILNINVNDEKIVVNTKQN